MKRILLAFFLLTGAFLGIAAQQAKVLRSVNMGKWKIPVGNYSGITPLGNDDYAVVDDKSPYGGFYVLHIEMDLNSGKIRSVRRSGFYGDDSRKDDDNEDIVFVPDRGTVFVTSEKNQTVEEYSLTGRRPGDGLRIPRMFSADSILGNCGFEALAYDTVERKFFLSTECALPKDKRYGEDTLQPIRIQCFDNRLEPCGQWAYLMEKALLKSNAKYYTHGIPAMLSDGQGYIYIMERELSVPRWYIGAKTSARIFKVRLDSLNMLRDVTPSLSGLPGDGFLPKEEVCSFVTRLSLGKMNFGNFEGMCWGPVLNDGRRTILLICDSQNGEGNRFYHLKDYLKVIIL